MTLVIGFKTSNTIHLVADTAVTFEGNSRLDFSKELLESSFLENYSENEKQVVEFCNKIVRINDYTIVSFSGVDRIAKPIIKEIMGSLQHVQNLSLHDFQSILQRCIHLSGGYINKIQLLFGFIDSVKQAHLLSYNHQGLQEIKTHEKACAIGAINVVTENQMLEGIENICRKWPNKLINIFLPSYLLQNNLDVTYNFSLGVGGAFVSAMINENGLTWQPHTLYITNLGAKNFSHYHLTTFVSIDGYIFLNKKGLAPSIAGDVDEQLITFQKFKDVLPVSSNTFEFFVILFGPSSGKKRVFCIIENDLAGYWFRLQNPSGDLFRDASISIEGSLEDLLFKSENGRLHVTKGRHVKIFQLP